MSGAVQVPPPKPSAAPPGPAAQRLGAVLVALQFLLLGLLAVLTAPRFASGQAPLLAWLVLAHAAALGVWALACNRPGNFNIRPTPRPGGQLVQRGPYRWVRHPMYSALLLAAGAGLGALATPGGAPGLNGLALPVAGAACVDLVAVLSVKARLEERWMRAQHPAYAAYRLRTQRFVPWVW